MKNVTILTNVTILASGGFRMFGIFLVLELDFLFKISKNHFLIEKRVPLSSTQTPSVQHISSTFGPHLFSPKNPSVPHQKPVSSTQPPQFHTENPSVQHQNSLSSTPKTPQFHTKKPSVPHQKTPSSTPLSSLI